MYYGQTTVTMPAPGTVTAVIFYAQDAQYIIHSSDGEVFVEITDQVRVTIKALEGYRVYDLHAVINFCNSNMTSVIGHTK